MLRRRAIEIVQYLARQASDNRFLSFCLNQSEDLDVEDGALFLAQTQYPDINLLAYQALFDSYAADLREQLDLESSAENIIATINDFLFVQLGYRGNEKNYYDPDNSYLNRVVDRRTGNPISLCAIYLLLAPLAAQKTSPNAPKKNNQSQSLPTKPTNCPNRQYSRNPRCCAPEVTEPIGVRLGNDFQISGKHGNNYQSQYDPSGNGFLVGHCRA